MSTLQKHQQRVIDKLFSPDSPHGIIAYHSMGSGKTFTALSAMVEAMNRNPKGLKALFIVPASLQDNIYKELDKHGLNKYKNKIEVYSYEKACNEIDNLSSKRWCLLVLDEAHRMRNLETTRVHEIKKLVDVSDKVLFLSGTASYNHPADVFRLIHLINPTEKLPVNNKDFEDEYINGIDYSIKNVKKLGNILNRYIDKYEVNRVNNPDYPTVNRELIRTEMTPRQASLYRDVLKELPDTLRRKLGNNMPMSLQESKNLNTYSTGIRQVSDSPVRHDLSTTWKDSAKITTAVNRMIEHSKKGKMFRGVVYSNFLDAGLIPYAKALEENGIRALLFTGSLNKKEKSALVQEYNSNDPEAKILLISSSGGEGLDLKKTRVLQVLEPHFNESKIRQVEGRAARYQSHTDLPKKDQTVLIEEYHSTLPKTFWQKMFFLNSTTAIDDYLGDISAKKQKMTDEMNQLINNSEFGEILEKYILL